MCIGTAKTLIQRDTCMRFLVGWDEPSEAELISLYLNVDGIEAILADDSEHLLQLAGDGTQWDAILMTTDTPDTATAFDLFLLALVRKERPELE